MASVATKVGKKSSLALAAAALVPLSPRESLSIYPSIVMMESSTIIPSVTISAARVTVFRSICVTNITAMAMAIHTGTPELAMSAERRGKSRSITTMTTSIAISRSRRKDHTDIATTLG